MEDIYKQTQKRGRKRKKNNEPNVQKEVQKAINKVKRRRKKTGPEKEKEEEMDDDAILQMVNDAVAFEQEEFDNDIDALQRRVQYETSALETKLGEIVGDINSIVASLEKTCSPFTADVMSVNRACHVMEQIEKLLTPRLMTLKPDFSGKITKGMIDSEETAKVGYDQLSTSQKNLLLAFFFNYGRNMAPKLMILRSQLANVMKTIRFQKKQIKDIKEDSDKISQKLTSFATETINSMTKSRSLGFARGGFNPEGFNASAPGAGIM